VTTPTIAIVDDDISIRESLQFLVRDLGYASLLYSSAESFLHAAQKSEVQCLVLDVALPGMSGPALHTELRLRGWFVPTIFMSARTQIGLGKRLFRDGATGFLAKPFDDVEFAGLIRTALAAHRDPPSPA
jgi:FixJ family two-component response regulator